MHQLHKELENFLDNLPGPKEPPKGSFYDLDCDEDEGETPRCEPGGQPGNQNARKHGFYSKRLPPEQQQELEKALNIKNPYQEIALLRVKLNAILADPRTPPELFLQTIHAFARLLAIERRYIWL